MPRRGSTPRPPHTRDEIIGRLENELYLARTALIDVMPAPLREVLDARSFCDDPDDAYEWEEWVIERVMAAAKLVDDPLGNPRAYCPLCNRGPSSPYREGFAFPVGLERHLAGSMRATQCPVMREATRDCTYIVLRRSMSGGPKLSAMPVKVTKPWKVPMEPTIVDAEKAPATSGQIIPLSR